MSKPKEDFSRPITEADRAELVEAADRVFERILERIEPENPETTRKLWNAEKYVDQFYQNDGRRMTLYDAQTDIDAFLVHYVISLATEADRKVRKRHLS